MIRKAPNWYGDNPTNPFLIKIKELPQIRASANNKVHLSCLVSIAFFLMQQI